jgi:DNA-directed RNA polymerase specialized sigma24 family protein
MERLALHDVDDTAAFIAALVQRSGIFLDYYDREDLEQHLLVEAWQLSLRFEPGGVSFATWAGTTLRHRVVDWQRKRLGRSIWKFKDRTYTRPQVQLVSLDDNSNLDQLGSSQPGSDLDDAEDRLTAERGLHGKRSRPPAGYAAAVRKGLPREAA